MIGKFNGAAMTAYVWFKGLLSDLKKDERAMEIVQVVLLILVGVLAITMINGLLTGWLQELWITITGVADTNQ
jgi:hypothetical protein